MDFKISVEEIARYVKRADVLDLRKWIAIANEIHGRDLGATVEEVLATQDHAKTLSLEEARKVSGVSDTIQIS